MSASFDWVDSPLAELTAAQLHDLLKLRVDVFVVEQRCVYPELDGQDALPGTRHLYATLDGVGVVAAARILAADNTRAVRIGRVVVAATHRGTGLSHQLMDRVMASCHQHYPNSIIELSAQVGVDDFYATYGFTVVSEDYLDDGIPHRDMRLSPSM